MERKFTRETPDFEIDNEFGQIGERRLLKILLASEKTSYVVDVRDSCEHRNADNDFVQVKTNGEKVRYEVKTDSKGLTSRNITYELTSHDYAGCLARCNAEYVFYVFTDDRNEIAEQYLINLRKLRHWMGDNCYRFNRDRVVGRLVYSTQPDNDGIPMNCLQILCNIDTMVADQVATLIENR